jgi:hypothetical protein
MFATAALIFLKRPFVARHKLVSNETVAGKNAVAWSDEIGDPVPRGRSCLY